MSRRKWLRKFITSWHNFTYAFMTPEKQRQAACSKISESLIQRGWTFLGAGRHRHTYGHPNKNIVIKLPNSIEGIDANFSEAKIWQRYGRTPNENGCRFARCRLLNWNDVPVLAMERVVISKRNVPHWAYYVDCVQVGKNSRGQVVAFDYTEF